MKIELNPAKWGKKDEADSLAEKPDLSTSAKAVESSMSVKTILDKIGADAKGVFAFLSSTKGQAIVATGEGVVEAVVPASTSLINLANTWLAEIVKSETIAAAAGATGSSTQKAAAVLSAVTPQAVQFAQANGLSAPTAASLEAANTALVAFANAFTVPAA